MLDREVSLFVPRNAQKHQFTEAECGLLNLLVHAVTIKFAQKCVHIWVSILEIFRE